MIQKKVRGQDGITRENKKFFLKAVKKKFSEDSQIRSDALPTANENAKTERGIPVHEPMSQYIRSDDYQNRSRELVTIDRSGRLVLPKRIRNLYDVNRFEVIASDNHIELIPVKPLHTLFGILPEIDMDRVYREHDLEVEQEDSE